MNKLIICRAATSKSAAWTICAMAIATAISCYITKTQNQLGSSRAALEPSRAGGRALNGDLVAPVRHRGKRRYVTRNGLLADAPAFSDAGWFYSGLALAVETDGLEDKYGYISRDGVVAIPLQYSKAGSFSEGLAAVEIDGKWGYIDVFGDIRIAPLWNVAGEFRGGIAKVGSASMNNHSQQGAPNTGSLGTWYYIDTRGNNVNPNSASALLYDNYGVVLDPSFDNAKWGFRDLSGKLVVPHKFGMVQRYSEGCAPVQTADGWGYINLSGNFIVKPKWDVAGSFHDGLAYVEENGKAAIINQYDELIWSE